MRKVTVAVVALLPLVGAGVFVIPRAEAIPPAARGAFTLVQNFTAANLAGAPGWGTEARMGIDSAGPYYQFTTFPVGGGAAAIHIYRPRGQVVNTPAEWGDGALAAVELFRKHFERFARSGNGAAQAAGLPGSIYAGAVPGGNLFFHVTQNGPIFGMPPMPVANVSADLEDFMHQIPPNFANAGAPQMIIVEDPTTNVFEDYEFRYGAM
jgi:hypothetical protein